jgi:hypothetical protein
MKRIAIGAVTGLAVWFASAVAAEAQQITPTGPMHIYSNDSSVTVAATVTTNYSFTLYLTTTLNRNGVITTLPNSGGSWVCINSGPSYPWCTLPALNSSCWGMQAGDIINFHMVAQINALHRGVCDYSVTVEPPQSGPTSKTSSTESGSLTASAGSVPATAGIFAIRREDLNEVLGRNERSVA